MTGIAPAIVVNDGKTPLQVSGAGFLPGTVVKIDGQPLANVTIQSPTSLTAVLPLGLCPGAHAVTVTTPLGQTVNASPITLEGKRTATVISATMQAPPITLTGREQTMLAPLPPVVLEDSTCGASTWRLSFTVSDASLSTPGRPGLAARSIKIEGSDGVSPTSVPVTRRDGRSEATLSLSRPVVAGPVRINPVAEFVVPPSAFAGAYTITASVQFVEGP